MTCSKCDRRVLVLGLMVSLWCVGGVRAATFTVTNTADSGAGSLRQSLMDADGPDDAVITFEIPGGGVHTITLASPLTVAGDVTIDGTSQPGYAGTNLITISGNGTSQVLDVTGGTVAIQGLTIAGGKYSSGMGGGILNGATLTLTHCTISGNSAYLGGGIYNKTAGSITLINCTISGNSGEYGGAEYGGGIYNHDGSTLTLTNCTISGNTAYLGSGIYNSEGSTLTLTNCTISGNKWGLHPMASDGGGIYSKGALTLNGCTISGNAAGMGGGIYNSPGSTLMLTNCTISGNDAYYVGGGICNEHAPALTLNGCTVSGNTAYEGGGIYSQGTTALTMTHCTLSGNITRGGEGSSIYGDLPPGPLTLTNCTVTGNTTGLQTSVIYNWGTLTLSNSIVAHGTFSDIVGGYTDGGHNIVQDGVGITQPTSKSGDPLIGPLADNGGPTQTHALLPGSPAVDAGDCNAAPESDQRGVSRPLGNACDIGAYESDFIPLSTTTELTSSLNPSMYGQSVTFTATVAATPPATATPVGTVTFQDGAATLATVALDGSGVAMMSSTALSCGDHPITATYDGDAGFTVSTSDALIQTVNRLSTTTVLTSSPNPAIVGQPVTLTATVAATPPGTGLPTGTVQFVMDDANIGDPVVLSDGAASISSDALPAGVHTVFANYGGDGDFTPSAASMDLTVSDAAPQTRPMPWCGSGIVETVVLSLVGLTAVSLRRRTSPRPPG